MKFFANFVKLESDTPLHFLQSCVNIFLLGPFRLINEISKKLVFLGRKDLERVVFLASLIAMVITSVYSVLLIMQGAFSIFTGRMPILFMIIGTVLLVVIFCIFNSSKVSLYDELNLQALTDIRELRQTVPSDDNLNNTFKKNNGDSDATNNLSGVDDINTVKMTEDEVDFDDFEDPVDFDDDSYYEKMGAVADVVNGGGMETDLGNTDDFEEVLDFRTPVETDSPKANLEAGSADDVDKFDPTASLIKTEEPIVGNQGIDRDNSVKMDVKSSSKSSTAAKAETSNKGNTAELPKKPTIKSSDLNMMISNTEEQLNKLNDYNPPINKDVANNANARRFQERIKESREAINRVKSKYSVEDEERIRSSMRSRKRVYPQKSIDQLQCDLLNDEVTALNNQITDISEDVLPSDFYE